MLSKYNCKYMPQMTIYLDRETDQMVREAARRAGESASKWVGEAIRRQTRDQWPADVLEILGSWEQDFPASEQLRAGLGKDVPREGL